MIEMEIESLLRLTELMKCLIEMVEDEDHDDYF